MKYQDWLKRNPPETWMTVLKSTGHYKCDLCGEKPHEAFVFLPPDKDLTLDRKGLFAIYGVCKDCKRLKDWKKRIESNLRRELTGKAEIDIVQLENAGDTTDAYFIVTIDGSTPKKYFHPKETQTGPLKEYELKPERVGAAVFRLENAKNLLKVLGLAAAENGDGDINKMLAPEHVMAHTKEN